MELEKKKYSWSKCSRHVQLESESELESSESESLHSLVEHDLSRNSGRKTHEDSFF